MINERFQLPNGQEVFTGNSKPEKVSTSFAVYPDADLLSLEQIRQVLDDPNRVPSRELFDRSWILNQGQRSSCNAYAVAGALARIRYRMGMDRVEFGPEFLYALVNNNQDRGSLLDDGMVAVTEHGICPRNMIPYESYQMRDVSIEARRVAKNYRAFECYQFPTDSVSKFWHAMVSAVCRNEIVVLALHVGQRFLSSRSLAGTDRGPGNHAVAADDARLAGRNLEDIQLDMFNSWGTDFGEFGRSWISVNHVAEPMRFHAMYAIRSATVDKSASNPVI